MNNEKIDIQVYPAGYLTEFIFTCTMDVPKTAGSNNLREVSNITSRLLLGKPLSDIFIENLHSPKVLGKMPRRCYLNIEERDIEVNWELDTDVYNGPDDDARQPFKDINIREVQFGMSSSAYIAMVKLLPQNTLPIAIEDKWQLSQLKHFLTSHIGARELYE